MILEIPVITITTSWNNEGEGGGYVLKNFLNWMEEVLIYLITITSWNNEGEEGGYVLKNILNWMEEVLIYSLE